MFLLSFQSSVTKV